MSEETTFFRFFSRNSQNPLPKPFGRFSKYSQIIPKHVQIPTAEIPKIIGNQRLREHDSSPMSAHMLRMEVTEETLRLQCTLLFYNGTVSGS